MSRLFVSLSPLPPRSDLGLNAIMNTMTAKTMHIKKKSEEDASGAPGPGTGKKENSLYNQIRKSPTTIETE